MRPQFSNGRYLPPWVLQAVGAVVFIAASVFWAVTGHQSALVMGAAIGLIGVGAYSGIHVSINQDRDRESHGSELARSEWEAAAIEDLHQIDESQG